MNKTKNNKYQSIFITFARKASKYLLVSVISWVIFFGLAQGVAGATLYCGSSARGTGSGADWDNQCAFNSQTLTRGNTYYIASGNYNASINGLSTAKSGTTPIYIKKCPASTDLADVCQSVAGWDDNYGTGQAVFNNTRVSGGGYIDIDGMTSYGIKINVPDTPDDQSHGIWINGSSFPHLKLKHIEFYGHGSDGNDWGVAQTNDKGATDTTGLLISHCSIHGMNTAIYFAGANNVIVEYNDMYDLIGGNHTNVMWIGNPSHDITIRYNKAHNYDTEGIFITYWNNGNSSTMYNFYIYGNVFYDGYNPHGSTFPRGVETYPGRVFGPVYVYNNTCVEMNHYCVSVSATSGEMRNNLSHGPNAEFGFYGGPSSNNVNTSDSTVFVNYAGKDFRLSRATAAGYALSPPYNVDADGKTRGADGVWDLGAYEYVSGPPDAIKPSAITNLSTSNPTSYSITLSWTAPGDDGNTGKASSYDIRYSTSNITEANWSLATQVSDEPLPLAADSPQSMTVTGLLPETAYYFAIKTRDESPANWSEISNVPSAKTSEAPSGLGRIEAESGAIADPMQIVSDAEASGGEYIQTVSEDEGTATYTFNIPETSIYKVIARVFAVNAGTDSFFFQIDSQAEDTWDFNPSVNLDEFSVWREDEVTKRGNGTPTNPQYDPYTLELTQGIHTLTFRGREKEAKLDYFRFAQTDDATPPAPPTGLTVN